MSRGGVDGERGRAGDASELGAASPVAVPAVPRAPRVPDLGARVDCPHAATCAGCPLIDQEYPRQLAAKRSRVVGAAGHYPSLEFVYTRPVEPADPITGYRTRAKLIVAPSGALGLFDRSGDHAVVDIPGCRVLAPALADVANALRALVAAPPAALRPLLVPHGGGPGGALRAVDLREVRSQGGDDADASVLVALVLQRDRAAPRETLRAAGRALRELLPRVVGVAANLHDGESPQVLGSETVLLDGAAYAHDRIGAAYHLATFGSFVQAHRGQAEIVHALLAREIASVQLDDAGPASSGVAPRPAAASYPDLRSSAAVAALAAAAAPRPPASSSPELRAEARAPRAAERPLRVLDLYGGSGAISLALAKAGHAVTMVESFAPAAQSARLAAEAQALSGFEVRTGDAAEVAGAMAAAGARFDAVVMNPPRRGVSPGAREAVSRLGAPLLLYVSCEPDTLARDLDHFARLGYAPGELTPIDMIPLTEEVETVAVLRRAVPPLPRVIYEDEEVIVLDKAAHEPVEPVAEYAGSLLQRVAPIPGSAAWRPVHRIDAGTSGLCMLARTEAARAAWAAALESGGRLVFVAAAKGITPAKGAITRELREAGRVVPARTRYRRLAVAAGHSVVRVIPDGGRTHQIRRHFAAIGHPVLGDDRYGHAPTNRYFEEKHGLDRTFIHLVRIEITHPRTGVKLLIESTLSGDLRATLERCAGGPSVVRFLEQKHALGDGRTSSIPPPLGDEGPRSSSLLPGPPDPRASSPSLDVSASGPPVVLPGTGAGAGLAPDVDEAPRTLRVPITSPDD